MAGKCKICNHVDRAKIDGAILNGDSNRSIAKQFGISDSSVQRHRESHMAKLLAESKEAEELRASNLLEQLAELHNRTLSLLASCEASGDTRGALQAISQARNNIELYGKISGQIAEQVNLKAQIKDDREFVHSFIDNKELSELACKAAEVLYQQQKKDKIANQL